MKKKSMIQVKKDGEAVIRKYLIELMQKIKIEKEGKASWPFSFDIEIIKEILTSKVVMKPIENNKEVARDIVFSAVIDLKKKGISNPSCDDFIQELEKQLNTYLNKPMIEYCLLFPIHATGKLIERKKWFNVLGTKFYRYDWKKIQAFSGWSDFLDHAKESTRYSLEKKAVMISNFTSLIVYHSARNFEEAFEATFLKFELLRSLLNLSFTFGKVTYQWGSPEPLGKILPPPFYGVFQSSGTYESLYYTREPYRYKKNQGVLAKQNIQLLEKTLVQIERINDEETQSILTDSLLKYVQAMDTLDWRDAFLSLWQILENLSLSAITSSLKMKEISSRINNLMGPYRPLHSELLKDLVETRNKLVHYGKFSKYGLKEVNFIKVIADLALSNFFLLTKKLPSKKSFEAFYRYESLGNSDLKNHSKVIGTILGLRNSKSKTK